MGASGPLANTLLTPFSVREISHLRFLRYKKGHCSYRRKQSKIILERIRSLDADLGLLFNLKPSHISTASLKFLLEAPPDDKAKRKLFFSSRARPSFIALSYCWPNDKEWKRVPGYKYWESRYYKTLPISETVFEELLKWKKPQEGVWIDALCINQDDKAEKVKAIASMDLVYTCARLVIVALEDIEIAGDEFELVKQLQGPDYLSSNEQFHRVDDGSFKSLLSSNATTVWNLVTKIGSARWFERAWCCHEFHLCRDAVFIIPCVGLTTISLQLRTLQRILQLKGSWISQRQAIDEGLEYYSRFAFLLASRFILSMGYVSDPPVVGICYLVERLQGTEDRDKVSIALNLLGLRLYFDGVVESEKHCRYILTILALAVGDPMALCCSGETLSKIGFKGSKSTLDLCYLQWPRPPDLVQLSDRYPPAIRQPRATIVALSGRLTIDILSLSGHVVRPGLESCERAKGLLEALWDNHRDILEMMEPEEWAKPMFDRKTAFVDNGQRYIACAINLGPHWMATALQKMGCKAIPKGLRTGVGNYALDPIWSLAKKFLFHNFEDLPERRCDRRLRAPLINFLVFALHHILLLGDTARYTAYIRFPAAGVRPVMVSFYHEFSGLDNVLSVPVALAGPGNAFIKRLWLLEKTDEASNMYRIQGKGYIWGCGALRPNRNSILRLRRINIGGIQ